MSCLRTPFGNKRVNGFQTTLKSAWHHHYPTFSWIRGKFSPKESALVICEILKLFLGTLTADDKYSRRNMKNFLQQVHRPFFQKEKAFCRFFIGFLKCAWNLEHFENKDEYLSLIISEIIESESCGCIEVWKVLIQNTIR